MKHHVNNKIKEIQVVKLKLDKGDWPFGNWRSCFLPIVELFWIIDLGHTELLIFSKFIILESGHMNFDT